VVSGGEPFMRHDLPELLASMARLGITARIASNGSLLTEDLLDRLRGETLTKSFQISLDTLDPDLYSEIHGAPAAMLEAALDALRGIRSRGFHTTVSTRLTPATLPGIPEILDRAVDEGWSTVTVHCPLHTGRTEGAWPQETDVLALLEPVFEHFLALPKRWIVETNVPWAGYHPVMQRLQERIRVVHAGCGAGRCRLAVGASGWISPCICIDVPVARMGNVRQDALAVVFRESPIADMMRHPQDYGICSDCPNVATCGGGCRAVAVALTGRLDALDESCPVRRSRLGKGAPVDACV
jgi:radical SAM protein with 4Fe4S-binding SPASM domain